MSTPKVLILRSPGTNCDWETQFAFEQAGATCERVHINQWLQTPDLSDSFQIICFPGGFSYGDDIGAGRILASQLQQKLAEPLRRFRDSEKLILGICNGFQVLMAAGLFGDSTVFEAGNRRPQTLTWNQHGRYEDRWVHLRAETDSCVFLRGIDRLFLPVAHAEGNFVVRSRAVADSMFQSNQLALSYAAGESDFSEGNHVEQSLLDASPLPFPENPNGSQFNIAGICDPTGHVFGLMPHPERYIDSTHHPHWTRLERQPVPHGRKIFDNAVQFFR